MITRMEIKNFLASMVASCKIPDNDYPDGYKIMHRFADYTMELIKTGNLNPLRECFKTSDFLLREGNGEIKNAVENVFIFSLALFLDASNALSRQVKDLLPASLREEYKRQLMTLYP
jgi:hypothetical protein